MIVLQTQRLVLRWFSDDDAPFILELMTDPAWIENIGDAGPRTLEEAQAWIESRLVAHYRQHGHGLWAMERRSDRALVGMCGLLRRPTLPSIDVGYALVPRARGHGYAREAAAACLAYGRDALGHQRIFAITSPGNLASVRVLEALGMKHQETKPLQGETKQSAVFLWSAG